MRSFLFASALVALGCASSPPAPSDPPAVRLDEPVACADGTRYDSRFGCERSARGTRLRIDFVNEMTDSFRLVDATFSLDGEVVISTRDPALLAAKHFVVLSTQKMPGEHHVGVSLRYSGWGNGVFSYLREYRFDVRSTHRLDLTESPPVTLSVVGYERGGATASLEQRPAVRYELTH